MRLTNRQVGWLSVGSVLLFGACNAMFDAVKPKPQAPVSVSQKVEPRQAAPITQTPVPRKIIKGRFVRTGEDFRHDVPADIEIKDDGTILVKAKREWDTPIGGYKASYQFTFKPNGRWTEKERTLDVAENKTYPFEYEGAYSLTKTNETVKISANFDELPRIGQEPWIAITFSDPESQVKEMDTKTSSMPTWPSAVESSTKIDPAQATPIQQTGMLTSSNSDAEIQAPAAQAAELPDATPECTAQIDQVRQQISRIKGAVLKSSETSIFSGGELEGYYPNGRNRTATYTLKNSGQPGETPAHLMRSPVLLTKLGTQIINACPDLSTVTFSVERSSWNETIGIFEDGRIRRFECANSSRENYRERQPYGYINCGI